MSETVIKAEGLGKKFIIAHKDTRGYKTFREQMLQHAHNLYARTKMLIYGQPILEGNETEDFWALKDLNFEIKEGDRIGIIGRNGAGKSTLLKILSRITDPSTGKVHIKGRVSSLLEVGTGFHHELTGRENIFLNGAILGMSRTEIRKKFDEIVSFSGIEKFLDTPVKRYSSGMYVRLAFSIAAHLEPEILIVDEVLAVGDAEFQEKCIGKMDEVGKSGRTILFVSHQMGLIAQLCNKAMLLEAGEIRYEGKTEEAIEIYNRRPISSAMYSAAGIGKDIFFQSIDLQNDRGESCRQFGHDESIFINLRIYCRIPAQSVQITIALLDGLQRRLFTLHIPLSDLTLTGNLYEGRIQLQEGLITPQTYNFLFDLFIPHHVIFDEVNGHFAVKVVDKGSIYAGYEGSGYGFYFINYRIID